MSTEAEVLSQQEGQVGDGRLTGKRGPKTKRQKIAEAMDRIDLAVAELALAVDVAARTDVPGIDVGANLVDELGPSLAKIGYEVRPIKKTRQRRG